MSHITDNESAAQAKYAIEIALLGGASWQLADGHTLLVELERGRYEFSVEWGKLIFAWWDDERSQSWNVTDYEIDATELRLRAVRGLGRETAAFTLRDSTGREWIARADASLHATFDALPAGRYTLTTDVDGASEPLTIEATPEIEIGGTPGRQRVVVTARTRPVRIFRTKQQSEKGNRGSS